MATPRWITPLFLPLPGLTGRQLETKTYTLGIGMLADQPARLKMPILGEGNQLYDEMVDAGIEPTISGDPRGQSSTWGGEPFDNYIRNESAESVGIRVDDLGARFIPDNLRHGLLQAFIMDLRGSGWLKIFVLLFGRFLNQIQILNPVRFVVYIGAFAGLAASAIFSIMHLYH